MKVLIRNGYKINAKKNREHNARCKNFSCVKCVNFDECMQGRDRSMVWGDCAKYGCLSYDELDSDMSKMPKDVEGMARWVLDRVYVLKRDHWETVIDFVGTHDTFVRIVGEAVRCFSDEKIIALGIDVETWMRFLKARWEKLSKN